MTNEEDDGLDRSLIAVDPVSPAGTRFVTATREAAERIAPRATASDIDGVMCEQDFADLTELGIGSAFVPEALGGSGLTSVHDWALGIAAIANADASVAIAINMHLGATRSLAMASAAAARDGEPNPFLGDMLRSVAAGDMLICAAATEPGTDNLHPLTEAVATGDGTHVINGQKTFVTMSPVATHIALIVRLRDDGDHIATTMLPLDTPGIVPQDDWEALGMRASGSQSIRLVDVSVPSFAFAPIGPWGMWSAPWLTSRALSNLPLLGASVGIAEAAYDAAIAGLQRSPRTGVPFVERPGVQHLAAEMAIGLTQARLVLAGTTRQVDDMLHEYPGMPPLDAAHRLMRSYQIAKTIINKTAIDVVNTAMDLVGGSSFTSSNVLSRLYRDVRAAPFMQPGAPAEARDYIGKVALGTPPER